MPRPTAEARTAIRGVLAQSGLSMRALSAAMGRDADYVAAFLDPARETRARPTPDDLLAASDATGIPLVELLDAVWGIAPDRLAAELPPGEVREPLSDVMRTLTPPERAQVIDYARFLAAQRAAPRRQR